MAHNIVAAHRTSVQLTLHGDRLATDDVSQRARVTKLIAKYRTERWTRIMGRAQLLASDQVIYLIGKDLDAFMKRQRWQAAQEPGTGQIVFNPDDYLDVQSQFRVGDYTLSAEERVEYAQIASIVRQRLRERAESCSHD